MAVGTSMQYALDICPQRSGETGDELLAGLVEIIRRRIATTGYSDSEMAKGTQISRTTINRYRHGDFHASGVNWRNVWPLMTFLNIDVFAAIMAVLCIRDPEAYLDPSYKNISYCASFLAKRLNEIVSENESGSYRQVMAQISPRTVELLAGFTLNHVETRLRALTSADEQLAAAA